LILDLRYLDISKTKKLNDFSEQLKLEFHTLIENLYFNGNNSIAWITSSVLSRNNYLISVIILFLSYKVIGSSCLF
jgi:hypothetical protein